MLCVTIKKKKKNRAILGIISCTLALGLIVFLNEILIVLLSCYWNGVYEC